MKKIIKLSIYSLVVMFLFNISIKAESIPIVQYQTHIQNIGWQSVVTNDNISGTEGLGFRLEAIAMSIRNSDVLGDISYQVHVENYGWMDPKSSGYIAGTEGQSLRLEAIRISLTGELENTYDIYYQVHVENYGWIDWAKNGEEAGSVGYAFRLEAIKVAIVKKGNPAPGNTEYHYYEKPAEVKYQTHIQDIGWSKDSINGEMSGTEGKGLRLEAIKLGVSSVRYSGGITYQTHVENIGWAPWVSDNNISGTEGQGLRLEAIKIALTGEISNHYDLYYRTHIQNLGWTAWVKNGDVSGSTNQGLRLESIEVKLVEKIDTNNETSNFIWYTQDGIKYLTNTRTGIIGTNVKKIIDVSEHQGMINWDSVKSDGVDGVILRIGYGSYSEDSKLARNISELKRLNIPYGIYLFSYAENKEESLSEANFVLSEITKYQLNPTLGIYYDLESWYINEASNTNSITIETYDEMINMFITTLSNAGYESSIYTYVNFANNKLSNNARTKIKWIAQYNSICNYQGNYNMWQFSSSEIVSGVNGRVDMNVMFN